MNQIDKTLKVIREAIEIERYGYEFYDTLRSQVNEPTGQVVLAFLAGLEVEHMVWLEKEYMRLLKSIDNLNESHVDDIQMEAREKIFLVDKLPEMYRGTDMATALEFAVQVEMRSVKFYTDAMNAVDDHELKETFRRLADFEMDHVKLLKLNIQNLKDKGIWTMPGEI
jgi:rubrerythrin